MRCFPVKIVIVGVVPLNCIVILSTGVRADQPKLTRQLRLE